MLFALEHFISRFSIYRHQVKNPNAIIMWTEKFNLYVNDNQIQEKRHTANKRITTITSKADCVLYLKNNLVLSIPRAKKLTLFGKKKTKRSSRETWQFFFFLHFNFVLVQPRTPWIMTKKKYQIRLIQKKILAVILYFK